MQSPTKKIYQTWTRGISTEGFDTTVHWITHSLVRAVVRLWLDPADSQSHRWIALTPVCASHWLSRRGLHWALMHCQALHSQVFTWASACSMISLQTLPRPCAPMLQYKSMLEHFWNERNPWNIIQRPKVWRRGDFQSLSETGFCYRSAIVSAQLPPDHQQLCPRKLHTNLHPTCDGIGTCMRASVHNACKCTCSAHHAWRWIC